MSRITVEFLQDILQESYPNVLVRDFETEPGSKRGDNYTSMLYRITLKGVEISSDDSPEKSFVEKPWKLSLIYKCLPESALRREAYKSDALFSNEIAFYNKILPSLLNFQRIYRISSPFRAIPRCYLARGDLVILEDLKSRGFTMIDRRMGLSTEQCYHVLKVMAHFHAISLAMKYQSSEDFQQLLKLQDGISEGIFIPENEDWYRSYYRDATRNALAMVEQQLAECEDRDKYLGKFREFIAEERFFKTMVELVTPKEPLAVISHGDCWTNNFLFRYDDGKIAEIYLVDFQLTRYASCTLDVAYVCYLCLSRAQRSSCLTSLLEHYCDVLHARLLEFTDDSTVFNDTLDKGRLMNMLKNDFRRAALFALGLSMDMLPIMTCDSDEAPNLYQAKETEHITSDLIKPVWTTNTICRKKMSELVQELVDENIL